MLHYIISIRLLFLQILLARFVHVEMTNSRRQLTVVKLQLLDAML